MTVGTISRPRVFIQVVQDTRKRRYILITGVILTHNEEDNVVGCIRALRPQVEEIILVDTESTDRTVELARPLVDKILHHPNGPGYDAARNIAISEAAYEWMWFVDADERIPPKTGDMIRGIIRERGDEMDVIHIPFKSYFSGQWMKHCGWWPTYCSPRVLKRGHFEFSPELHSGVRRQGNELLLPADETTGIEHYSYRSIEHWLDKNNKNTSNEAQQLSDSNVQWHWRSATRAMVHDLWEFYEFHDARQDGDRGWALTWLAAQYRWLSFAKLIDLGQSAEATGGESKVPRDLDEFLQAMGDDLSELRSSAPRLPLGIVWRAPLWNESGYAEEARCFVKGLAHQDRDIVVDDFGTFSDSRCPLLPSDDALLRALRRTKRPSCTIAVTHGVGNMAPPDRRSSFNAIRTLIETDRLPVEWRENVSRYDEVWVTSDHVAWAFARSGIAPERIRQIPESFDSSVFTPVGRARSRPEALADRFTFLSIFDWVPRKGWDVLLRAYCEEFSPEESVGLLIKLTRVHGNSMADISSQIDDVLGEMGQSLPGRSDIVLSDETLSTSEMGELYRGVDAFVLPTRGEGWGRPFMEAMACGLPTIGTRAGGNLEFMNESNSYLVDTQEVPVPQEFVDEFPLFRGHRWLEPDAGQLRALMRQVFSDSGDRTRIASEAEKVREQYDLESGQRLISDAIDEIENRYRQSAAPVQPHQLRVCLEGELFANHSFSNINEVIAQGFIDHEDMALTVHRTTSRRLEETKSTSYYRVSPYIDRPFDQPVDVTIRHSFPPNWERPNSRYWIQIQPWEFRHLPIDWVAPLRDQVDEIWVPSEFVRQVYLDSGIPAEKIQVMSWGVDSKNLGCHSVPRLLDTEKSFKFLYVGGLIARKGFDLLVEAYLNEFGPDDDVCLVVKDFGSKSIYSDMSLHQTLLAARDDPTMPEIVYLDGNWTTGQLAGLYRACDCFAAPYRGEGFGLPILEAMACGIPAIVPSGGATDDFVDEQCGYLVDSEWVHIDLRYKLCGPSLELLPDRAQLRQTMRDAYLQRQRTESLGEAAAKSVSHLTWDRTVERMVERLKAIPQEQAWDDQPPSGSIAPASGSATDFTPSARVLAGVVFAHNSESAIGACLSSMVPFVDEVLVIDGGSDDRTNAIASEYGARIVEGRRGGEDELMDHSNIEKNLASNWYFSMQATELCGEEIATQIRTAVDAAAEGDSLVTLESGDSNRMSVSTVAMPLAIRRRGLSNTGDGKRASIGRVVSQQSSIENNLIEEKHVNRKDWSKDTPLLVVLAEGGENLDWLHGQSSIPFVVSQKMVDDPICGVPVNKGAEAAAYLRFIINNFDDLPKNICFLNGHERFRRQRSGVMEKLLEISRSPSDSTYLPMGDEIADTSEQFRHWRYELFKPVWDAVVGPHVDEVCPTRIVCDSSAQFAVSRDLIRTRPLELYEDLYEYAVGTKRWSGDADWKDASGYRYSPGGEPGSEVGGAYFLAWIWHIVLGQESIMTMYDTLTPRSRS